MASEAPSPRCAACGRPAALCVCDRVVPLGCRLRLLVLQHPQELDVALGSAQLLAASLPRVTVTPGLSWPSLAAALGDAPGPRSGWAVIFPDGKLTPDAAVERDSVRYCARDRSGRPLPPTKLTGLVALDGSWSQAKSLWWRNPWLLKLGRLTLFPTEPGIYGKLRREPRAQYLSTLEAVADALVACGEPAATREALRRLFRTLVQRARDARRTEEERR